MRLLHEPTFRALWAANTISTFGTLLGALSLTALLYLDATPAEMGVLAAASSLPVLLFALLAGVYVDWLQRVPVMVSTDILRFALLFSVPAAAVFGELHVEQLYAVAFVVGGLNVMFHLAFRSVLPGLVPPERLVDANSTLAMSESASASVSPAVGGAIVQVLGAPVAVLLDAITFLASGLFLRRIRSVRPIAAPVRRSVWKESIAGFEGVIRQPLLRSIFAMVVSYSFFSGFIVTLYGLWVIDGVGFSAFTLGVLLAAGGIGAIIGARYAGSAARVFGVGRTIVVTYFLAAGLMLAVPFVGGWPVWLAFAVLLVEQCAGDGLWSVHNIHALSLRQGVTPMGRLGRVNATFLLGSQGLRPIAALVAGAVAEAFGVQTGLIIAAVGINLAGLWLVFSPLRGVAVPSANTVH